MEKGSGLVRFVSGVILAAALAMPACTQETEKSLTEEYMQAEEARMKAEYLEILRRKDNIDFIQETSPQINQVKPQTSDVTEFSLQVLLERAVMNLETAIEDEKNHLQHLNQYTQINDFIEDMIDTKGVEKYRAEIDSPLNRRKGSLVLEIKSKYGEDAIYNSYHRLSCAGVPKQGGAVICKTRPNVKVKIGRSNKDFYYEKADEDGQIIVGFDRDEKRAIIDVMFDKAIEYNFTPRTYDTSRIDGLPPSQVSTFTEAQLKRIRSSSARKKVGFASRAKEMGFKDGFISPVKEYRKTTNFGAQRILNGEPKKPHYGVDMAAPIGTPIYAPADGIVSLADDDLYFEGAMVLLDHGQGLISMYLHTDSILVEPGQRVKQGEQIATVGSKGRSTGPHLCWRLKWRNRNLDPELLTEWPR